MIEVATGEMVRSSVPKDYKRALVKTCTGSYVQVESSISPSVLETGFVCGQCYHRRLLGLAAYI